MAVTGLTPALPTSRQHLFGSEEAFYDKGFGLSSDTILAEEYVAKRILDLAESRDAFESAPKPNMGSSSKFKHSVTSFVSGSEHVTACVDGTVMACLPLREAVR